MDSIPDAVPFCSGASRAPAKRTTASTLFHVGVALSLSHLAISLELSVTISFHGPLVKSFLLLLYPVSYAFMGIGAVIDARWLGGKRPGVPLRIAGAILILFLFLALRVNFLVTSLGEIVWRGMAHAAVLATWFLLLGAAMHRLLRNAHLASKQWTRIAWASHLAGLLLGYALVDFLVSGVGVNVLLLSVGCALLLAPRSGVVLLAMILLLSPVLSLENRLEDLRDVTHARLAWVAKMSGNSPAPEGAPISYESSPLDSHKLLFRGWSRYAQVRILQGKGRSKEVWGLYNFYHQWDTAPRRDKGIRVFRRAVYGAVKPGSRVVVVAVGGGSGLHDFPAIDKNLVAVERDPVVVRFLRDEQPELNGGVFRKVTILARDGRQVIETTRGKLDAIIIESGRYQPARVLDPAGAPLFLYTEEAIFEYLSKLEPDGLLLLNFNRVHNRAEREYIPLQALGSLERAGVPHIALWSGPRERPNLYFAASPTERGLDRIRKRVERPRFRGVVASGWQPRSKGDPLHTLRLTDDAPFSGWVLMGARERSALWCAGAGVLAAILLGVTLAAVRKRPPSTWNPAPYFLLIGIGHVVVVMHAFYAYRSFFGDEILTVIRLLMYFLVWGAAGSVLAGWASVMVKGRGRRPALFGTLAALHVLAIGHIPFQWPCLWERELYGFVSVAPGGLALGLLFPMGLLATDRALIGRALFSDSLGTLAGYALFYLVYLTLGGTAFLAVGIGVLAMAVWLYRCENHAV